MGMMRWAGLAALAALAGCAGIDDRVRGGGGGLPEVTMNPRTVFVVPPGRWRTGLALRTFVPGADGSWQEVVGARCRVVGGEYYRAEVVTPVRIVLPDLGPDAPPLTATCSTLAAGGTISGTATVAPVYGWPEEGRPDAVRRAAWGGGWWWGYQKTGPMAYPDLAVAMR
jgi:hypothetical protein